MNITKHTAVGALITIINAILAFIRQNRNFAFAFLMTSIFYLPALKGGAIDAGFLYTGDPIGFYLPELAKTHSLLSSFNFTALDFSAFNGSSDFYLAANFFAVHPMVVVYSLLVPAQSSSMQQEGHFLVFMMAVHSFLACYFSLKLFTRFFSFEFGVAALIATVFAFNMHIANALGEPEFIFSVATLSWVAYGALAYVEKPTFKQLVFACLPVLFTFLGGYIPLGLATLALSVILVATKLLLLDDSGTSLDKRVHVFLLSLLPYVCALFIVSPYLYSVHKFLGESQSASYPSLFFSAHQYAENPQALLRLFSSHYYVPGSFIEFSLVWGFIAVAIAALFLLSPKTIDALTPRDWKIFKISALLYFLAVLAIYGEFSVVSDWIYYLVPQIGKMHIYQRFLVPMHLFFAVMIALMLKALVETRPAIATRIALAVIAFFTLAAAYLVGRNPTLSQEIGLNGYIIFELMLCFLFVFSLLVPGKAFVYAVTLVLLSLPTFDQMYDYSHGGNTFEEQRKRLVVALDETERAKLVAYFKRFSDKAIIKYVDITPRWTKEGIEPFPKSFPYFVLNEIQLSSYSGFNFYLSSRADYMRKMPIVSSQTVLAPDWEMVVNSGADFVVALTSDLQGLAQSGMLANTRQEDWYRLPNDVVIIPLHKEGEKMNASGETVFDNGYFRVSPGVQQDDSNLVDIAIGKSATESSFGGGEAKLAVDGNKDGDFNHGSVSHTGRDSNAWLEVDLGKVESIDSVRIWNRTDCCASRLSDYWVFISETPFLSSDTSLKLRERPTVWNHHNNFSSDPQSTIRTGGVHGRYVRVQLSGSQPKAESFLSLAELEVLRSNKSQDTVSLPQVRVPSDLRVTGFTTNNANYLRLDLESSAPATVEYLFWSNPGLHYYLNDQRANTAERNGVRVINVPAGHNTIEIRYRNWPLTLFWVFYALYALTLLWVMLPVGFTEKVRSKFSGQNSQ